MVFIFNDTPGLHAVATTQTGLADQTTAGGTQSEACGAPVMPPGMDPVSAGNCAAVKSLTTQYGAHFATAGVNQQNYASSISESATAYSQTDTVVNTAGIAEVGVNAAQVAAGLNATRV
jgi:PE family